MSFSNQSCAGGTMDNAFLKHVKYNGGIDTENYYSYTGEDPGAYDAGFVDVASGDENALADVLATVEPVSAAYCTSQLRCTMVVGHNTTKSRDDYWIVKNSWGKKWGDGGCILMARNMGNNCGIATSASYPLVEI
ncbi:Peptidase C1A, papain C-terminal [Cinara cedri]|uniref:Peptidase C1A, papain C-terminal n=1 Tax=Cinara cedri TaxID=506608 RepID=A0A5E4M782_9HEMI|nr:Peptidase C1A, papain C-terminal [Cinara cedri]